MASILETLFKQLSGGGMKQLSQQIGAEQKQTEEAVSTALPTLLAALSRNASKSEGASALLGALQRDHDGSVLENLAGYLQQGKTDDGDGILRHVLGNRRNVVERGLSQTSGLDTASSNKLMSLLAPMLMGALGKQQRQEGLGADALAGLLTREQQTVEKTAPQEMGMIGRMLDADGDGDFDAGDLLKHGGKVLGKLFGR